MPITAYSISAKRELDLEQWLAVNGYASTTDPTLSSLPPHMRDLATRDIVCSSCSVLGATLVRGARSRGTGRAVGQGHFRFAGADGANRHHALCDFVDEGYDRSGEYLSSFANDKSALTRAIRDLACRGINASVFTAGDMRAMRAWFFEERVAHSMHLDVTGDLITWCKEASAARWVGLWDLRFQPEHARLPGFDWDRAAKQEWARRNQHLLKLAEHGVHFRGEEVERARRLITKYGGRLVLDPSTLREKYISAVQLSRFVAEYVFGAARKPTLTSKHDSDWGVGGHALLALSALLLFKSDWDVNRAGSMYARLHALPPAPDGLAGNIVGLNPFHDYHAWKVIHSAKLIGDARTDQRPVHEQIADVKTELFAMQGDWVERS